MDGNDAAWTMIRGVFGSVARVAIVPLQDVLDRGAEARMTLPGRGEGNWQWRFREGDLGPIPEGRLAEMTELFGRTRPRQDKEEEAATEALAEAPAA